MTLVETEHELLIFSQTAAFMMRLVLGDPSAIAVIRVFVHYCTVSESSYDSCFHEARISDVPKDLASCGR